jgi:hypothetical protein
MRRLADAIEALVKLSWPRNVSLSDTLGAVERVSAPLADLEKSRPGFLYHQFIARANPSIKVRRVRDEYFLLVRPFPPFLPPIHRV